MNWLVFVIIAVLADTLRIFIDNYISDTYFREKNAVSQKIFYGYLFAITAIIIFAVTNFDITTVDPSILTLLIASGILTSISGIPYFRALEIDDSTNIGIFIQLSPVLYLIFGWFLLGETFSPAQLVAFFFIIAAPLLIVLTSRKNSRKVRLRAILFSFLYVLIAVIGNIIFLKADTTGIELIDVIAIIFLSKGISDLIICYSHPKWRKRFRFVVISSKFKVFRPLIIDGVLSLVKEFAYRAALIAAPTVALASAASDSVEPIVIFFLGLLLTIMWPKFGREKLDKKTVLVHLAATVLVVTGILFLQI